MENIYQLFNINWINILKQSTVSLKYIISTPPIKPTALGGSAANFKFPVQTFAGLYLPFRLFFVRPYSVTPQLTIFLPTVPARKRLRVLLLIMLFFFFSFPLYAGVPVTTRVSQSVKAWFWSTWSTWFLSCSRFSFRRKTRCQVVRACGFRIFSRACKSARTMDESGGEESIPSFQLQGSAARREGKQREMCDSRATTCWWCGIGFGWGDEEDPVGENRKRCIQPTWLQVDNELSFSFALQTLKFIGWGRVLK